MFCGRFVRRSQSRFGVFSDEFPETCALIIQIRAPLENISHACTKDPFTSTGKSSFFIPSQRFAPMCIAEESTWSSLCPKAGVPFASPTTPHSSCRKQAKPSCNPTKD